MDDKSIRSILISYLKAANREIRIYQEKSIGSSVCDLMTVTDVLTGYEIKSDADNYQRLDAQVTAYNQFFDRNYIVVGASHARSIYEKVPAEWGIIVIQNDSVAIKRKARKGCASGRRQLGILWRLELTNLLTKFLLPLYTYKSKAYIIRQICEHLEEAEIKPQAEIQNENKPFVYLERNDVKYLIYTGKSAAGNAKRVANFIKRFYHVPQTIEESIHKHMDEIAELKTMNESPNPYLQEIRACEKELLGLRERMNL